MRVNGSAELGGLGFWPPPADIKLIGVEHAPVKATVEVDG
jgi:hypothetical protein